METTKQPLNAETIHFFKRLSEAIDTKLLFFGSVQRNDYFPGKSDVDVDVFTENEHSTIVKMQHFLNVPKEKFKKIIWKLNVNGQVVHGYKLMYKNKKRGICAEFSIYNEKYKQGILQEHLHKTYLPFYASWMLCIIKTLFYNLNAIDKTTFTYLKKKILGMGIGLPDDQFIVLENYPTKK